MHIAFDDDVDQEGARLGERRFDRRHDLIRRLHPSRRHAQGAGELGEVELGAGEIERERERPTNGAGLGPILLNVHL